MISIERPSLALAPSFRAFIDELRAAGEPVWAPYTPRDGETDNDFVARMLRGETDPEPPLVPETIHWGVLNGQVVGRISLRHRLNHNLSQVGGHIGYEVRPSSRRQGIATEMLRLLLQTPKAREIGRLLLTCAPDNIASNKTILSNRGVFEKKIFAEIIYAERNRYWIELGEQKE